MVESKLKVMQIYFDTATYDVVEKDQKVINIPDGGFHNHHDQQAHNNLKANKKKVILTIVTVISMVPMISR